MWKITLKRLYRNPKYPLALAIGIILSVSIIVGINMTVDQMTGIVVQSRLNNVPVDFVASKTLYDITKLPDIPSLKSKITGIKGVHDAEFMWNFYLFTLYFNKTPTNCTASRFQEMQKSNDPAIKQRMLSSNIIGIPSDFGFDGNGITWIDGGLDTSDNFSIGVPVDFAQTFNLKVGDVFYLTSLVYNLSELDQAHQPIPKVNNIKLRVSGVYKPTGLFETYFNNLKESSSRPNLIYFIGTFNSAYEVFKNTTFGNAYRMQDNFNILIFLDRKNTVRPYNMESTNRQLNKINIELSTILEPQGFTVTNVIGTELQDLTSWLNIVRIQFGLFSLPVIIVGLFLTTTIAYVVLELKRREIGLLKVRGATNSQIRKTMVLEIISIGLVAAVFWPIISATFTAYLVSRLSLLWGTQGAVSNFMDVGSYLYIGIILSFIFAAVAAFIPYKLVANMRPIEAIGRTIEQEEIKKWKPKWVVLGLLLGGYKLIAWIIGFDPNTLFDALNPTSFIIVLLLTVFLFVDLILQYIGPIIFVYSATKVTLMKMPRLMKYIEPFVMRTGGALGKISLTSILKKTSRYARVCFIISLAISFGITFAVNQATIYNYQVQTIKVTNGADINLQIRVSNLNILENISKIPGVTGVAYFFEASVTFGGRPCLLVAVDPSRYLSVSSEYLSNDLSVKGIKNSLALLASHPTYVLASKHFTENSGFDIGDTFNLVLPKNENDFTTLTLQLIDSLYALPGDTQVFSAYPLAILINIDLLNSTGILKSYIDNYRGVYTNFLIDVSNTANSTAVANELKKVYRSSAVSITEQQIAALGKDPYFASITEFLNLEYFLMILIATLVLGFIMYLSITERQKEFGVMIARGAGTSQIIRLLLAESIIIILVALTIGIVTGLATGLGLAVFSTSLYNRMIPVTMVIPLDVYLLIVSSTVVFIISTSLPGYIASRLNLRNILRDV